MLQCGPRYNAGHKDVDMTRLYQITEEDLGELERTLPQICEDLMANLDGRLRTQFRRCQTILSQVRWRYGPASEVERIPADGDQTS
jgi:hypothetical protein